MSILRRIKPHSTKGQSGPTRWIPARLFSRHPWKSTLGTLVLGTLVITGCSTQAKTGDQDIYPYLYQTATEQWQSNSPQNDVEDDSNQSALHAKFANFIGLFAEFKHHDLRPLIEEVYSEELYFNDTIHTFNSREVMLEYMQNTADRVEYTNVDIKDIVQSGDDFYVRWAMDTGFKVFGKQIETHSIGMTHIRFDEDGRINFHQDFWDNTEGFFRHLPVIGYLINKTKQRL
ncbi:MAG: nuclear transport factor 2 family protein [Acidiferrobacterales bacterium]|nr:nuclear transport factor 2 family protein [Acidiferrobacterales bacterium]